MGGKSSQSTQTVTIPPEVLARYNSVNATAEKAAATPFQQYSTDPNAFVAPLTGTQQAGIANTNYYAGTAQPYYAAATQQQLGAQEAAVPYYRAATQNVGQSQDIGSQLAGLSMGSLYGGQQAAARPQQQAQQAYQQGYYGAQPYQGLATGLTLSGAQAVNPQALGSDQINQYMSPYLGSVLSSTAALQNQMNQQAMSGQTGNAIRAGAFGGDRAGIAAANLAQQQQLANAKTFSDILNTGYGQALSTAQGQQQLGLSAAQANRAAQQQAAQQALAIGQQGYAQGLGYGQAQQGLGQQLYGQGSTTAQQLAALGQQQYGQGMTAAQQQAALGQGIYGMGSQTAQQLAALGQGAQSAGLQGAQAQLAAGQAQQQTQQAGQTALYNQFLQQQSYPFQVAQFLANIAEGTGALSGSTTTGTSSISDRRAKHDIHPIGKTFDGQNIYSFKYKGDDRPQIGLMAQEVEHHHPEAVGLAGGLKTVDYGKATEEAAHRGHFASGGLAGSAGGAVGFGNVGEGFAYGGMPDQMSGYNPLAFDQMYAGLFNAGHGGMNIPAAQTAAHELAVARPMDMPKGPDMLQEAGKAADAATAIGKFGNEAHLFHFGTPEARDWGHKSDNQADSIGDVSSLDSILANRSPKYRGGLADHRIHRDLGGGLYGNAAESIVPDEKPGAPKLLQADPSAMGKPSNGMGGVGSALGAASSIASLIPGGSLVSKGLGAAGKLFGLFADGGEVDDTLANDKKDEPTGLVAPAPMADVTKDKIAPEEVKGETGPAQRSIPTEKAEIKPLDTPKLNMAKPLTFLEQLKMATDAGKNIAAMAGGAKHGGFIGYADGGAPSDHDAFNEGVHADPVEAMLHRILSLHHQDQPEEAGDGLTLENSSMPVNKGLAGAQPIAGARRETAFSGPGKLDPGIVSFFMDKGLSEDQARGIAAGIHAESGSNPSALNKSSGAMGLGQWLGSRKAGIVKQYGTNPSKAEQLEYLWGELAGGDRGGARVLSQKDPRSVLSAYITHFMRPAAGYETESDISRGHKALGYADGGLAGGLYSDDNEYSPVNADTQNYDFLDNPDPEKDASSLRDNRGTPASVQKAIAAANAAQSTNAPESIDTGELRNYEKKPGFLDNITHGKFISGLGKGEADSWIPLIAGIGASMAGPYRGVVGLGQGLAAGAQTAQNLRKYELEQELGRGQLGLKRFEASWLPTSLATDRFKALAQARNDLLGPNGFFTQGNDRDNPKYYDPYGNEYTPAQVQARLQSLYRGFGVMPEVTPEMSKALGINIPNNTDVAQVMSNAFGAPSGGGASPASKASPAPAGAASQKGLPAAKQQPTTAGAAPQQPQGTPGYKGPKWGDANYYSAKPTVMQHPAFKTDAYTNDTDPVRLQRLIQNFPNDPRASQWSKTYEGLMNGSVLPKLKTGQFDPDFVNWQSQQAAYGQRAQDDIKASTEFRKANQNWQQISSQTDQSLSQLDNAGKNYDLGRSGDLPREVSSKLAHWLGAAGYRGEALSAAQSAQAAHNAIAEANALLVNSGITPINVSPPPTQTSAGGLFFGTLMQHAANDAYKNKMKTFYNHNDTLERSGKSFGRLNDFNRDWNSDNPIENFMGTELHQKGFFKGMSDDEKNAYIHYIPDIIKTKKQYGRIEDGLYSHNGKLMEVKGGMAYPFRAPGSILNPEE